MLTSSLPTQELVEKEMWQFFARGKAGCIFAAVAARRPDFFRWRQTIVWKPSILEIDRSIAGALSAKNVSTLTLVFPTVTSVRDLRVLIGMIRASEFLFVEDEVSHDNLLCLGIRARIGPLTSWVTGFATHADMPVTRRAPYTALTLRIKPRPKYSVVMKKAPENVIHLADMNMRGLSREQFQQYWDLSHTHTARLLGHKPNIFSAAKTTFVLPRRHE